MLAGRGPEGLVGALQDALRADVDPAPRRHLAVHDQPELLQSPELLPIRPVPDQIGVGDEHPRRLLLRPEHADGFAGGNQQSLVVLQPLEFPHDGVEAGPVAGRLARAPVNHQLLRALGDLGIEVVHEHPQSRFLRPPFGPQHAAARRANHRLHHFTISQPPTADCGTITVAQASACGSLASMGPRSGDRGIAKNSRYLAFVAPIMNALITAHQDQMWPYPRQRTSSPSASSTKKTSSG